MSLEDAATCKGDTKAVTSLAERLLKDHMAAETSKMIEAETSQTKVASAEEWLSVKKQRCMSSTSSGGSGDGSVFGEHLEDDSDDTEESAPPVQQEEDLPPEDEASIDAKISSSFESCWEGIERSLACQDAAIDQQLDRLFDLVKECRLRQETLAMQQFCQARYLEALGAGAVDVADSTGGTGIAPPQAWPGWAASLWSQQQLIQQTMAWNQFNQGGGVAISLEQMLLNSKAASQQPPNIMPADSSDELLITLAIAPGFGLGIDGEIDFGEEALIIDHVRPGGAIAAWNRQCQGKADDVRLIRPGYKIVSVNGVTGDPWRMIKECEHQRMVKLRILSEKKATRSLALDWLQDNSKREPYVINESQRIKKDASTSARPEVTTRRAREAVDGQQEVARPQQKGSLTWKMSEDTRAILRRAQAMVSEAVAATKEGTNPKSAWASGEAGWD